MGRDADSGVRSHARRGDEVPLRVEGRLQLGEQAVDRSARSVSSSRGPGMASRRCRSSSEICWWRRDRRSGCSARPATPQPSTTEAPAMTARPATAATSSGVTRYAGLVHLGLEQGDVSLGLRQRGLQAWPPIRPGRGGRAPVPFPAPAAGQGDGDGQQARGRQHGYDAVQDGQPSWIVRRGMRGAEQERRTRPQIR